MKIRKKIFIAPLAAIVVMLLLGIIGFVSMRSAKSALDDFSQMNRVRVNLSTEVQTSLLEASIASYRLIVWIGDLDAERIRKDTQRALDFVDAANKSLTLWAGDAGTPEEERKQLAVAGAALEKYRKAIAQAIDMASSDPSSGAGMMQAADKRYKEVDDIIERLHKAQLAEAGAMVEGTDARLSRLALLQDAVLIVGALLALTITVTLSRGIVRPLQQAVEIATQIARGNLSNHIVRASDDETGDLMRALTAMQEQLNTLIGTVAQGASRISDTSGTLSTNAAQLAQSSGQQSERVTAVAATIEELAVSISEVAQSVTASRNIACEAAESADTGLTLVTRAGQGLDTMTSTIAEAVTDIEQLSETSRQITELADSIREIADQTNLLALNAAIEAARAGESGRGFAVVADEVRKLAEKTGAATTNIKSMLDTIAVRTEHSVRTVNEVSVQAGACVTQIREMVSPLEHIRQGARTSLDSLEQLTQGVAEQVTASNEVAQHMENIANLTEQNSRSTQIVSGEAATLSTLAQQMSTAVSKFRVDSR